MPKLKQQTKHLQAEKLARILLAGKSRSEAAKLLGISESTLDRWLKSAEFPTVFEEERKRLLPLITSRIQHGLETAIEALCRNAACGQPQIEVKAASELVGVLLRIEEHIDFSERLSQLEGRR